MLVRSFVRVCSFVNIGSLMLLIRGLGDVIKYYISILDCIGALDRRIA